jgi:putative FmdB family regulatory protein
MPMYGFVCQRCGEQFEEWVRSATAVDTVTCPACDGQEVDRQLSRIAPIGRSGSSRPVASSANCAPTGI